MHSIQLYSTNMESETFTEREVPFKLGLRGPFHQLLFLNQTKDPVFLRSRHARAPPTQAKVRLGDSCHCSCNEKGLICVPMVLKQFERCSISTCFMFLLMRESMVVLTDPNAYGLSRRDLFDQRDAWLYKMLKLATA